MTIHDLPNLSKNQMENLFEQSKKRSCVFMLVTLAWAAFYIWLYFTTSNLIFKKSLFIFFCIALVFWFVINMGQLLLLRLFSVKLSKFKEPQIGQFTIQDVRLLVDEVLDVSIINEKPEVYIWDIDMVNALVINIYLLNFLKPANAVYITKKSFTCLSREEMKAMLMHEMGHFNQYIFDENKILNIGLFLFFFMPFAFTVLLPGVILKIGFIIFTFFAGFIIAFKIRNLKDYDDHTKEYLCDLYAAEKVGRLNTINMLITISKENAVTKEDDKAKILKKIFLPVKRFMVDWSTFDTHIVNGKIELEEYDSLIEALEKVENPQLLDNTLADHNSRSHPSLTNRVLFLHKNLKN